MRNLAQRLLMGCLAYTAAISLPVRGAHAGAWPQPADTTEVIVSVTHSLAHRQFDPRGTAQPRGRFRKIETQVYAEHGLTSRVTLIGEVARSTDKSEVLGVQFTNSAFRRLEAGARVYLFTWKETLYSIDGSARLNTASHGNDPAASQSGDWDFEAGLSTGVPFSQFGLTGFNETRIAYLYRPGVRPPETTADTTMGLKFGEEWIALLKSQNAYSLGRTPSPLGHFWSSKAELGIVRRFEPGFAVEAAASQTIAGRNVPRETSFKLAFWYTF